MADFLSALDDEIAKLEAELSADLRYQRLLRLRSVRALYPESQGATGESVDVIARPVGTLRPGGAFDTEAVKPPKPKPQRRASPERQRALDAARMYLENRKGPVPTRVIFEHIAGLGIEIPGEKPLNNLSAMLSNSSIFESHGRSGWVLAGAEFEPERQPSVFDLARAAAGDSTSASVVGGEGDDGETF